MLTKKYLLISILVTLLLYSSASLAIGEYLTKISKDIKASVGVDTSAEKIDRDVNQAWKQLLTQSIAAKHLSERAKAILIFPSIIKAGLGVGGHYGEGALRQNENEKSVAYYNSVAGSYGLQIGAQSFGYAMFFMTDEALQYLSSSEGWEVGVGPSIVIVDEGMAKTMTSATIKDSIYVFIFNQAGLMAGVGIQGSKISRINPKP